MEKKEEKKKWELFDIFHYFSADPEAPLVDIY